MKILAIESSCDETAAAVVEDGTKILSNVVVSQVDIFAAYGGVIPEVAARSHLEVILPVVEKALKDAGLTKDEIDAIAVTHTPGLMGSLLIGTLTARMLAILWGKPLFAVHHLKSHIYANWLKGDKSNSSTLSGHDVASARRHGRSASSSSLVSSGDSLKSRRIALISSGLTEKDDFNDKSGVDFPEFPLLALVVSGGHTQIIYMPEHNSFEIIGTTRDDAVGECFDKVAKILGLPYPGGPSIAKCAAGQSIASFSESVSLSGANPPTEGRAPDPAQPANTPQATQYSALPPVGNSQVYRLPHPKVEGLDFSFSGLKTAVLRAVQAELGLPITTPSFELKKHLTEQQRADFAAAFQETACDILIDKLKMALEAHQEVKSLVFAGGVSANKVLREKALKTFQNGSEGGFKGSPEGSRGSEAEVSGGVGGSGASVSGLARKVYFPEVRFAGDNGAMVGAAAYFEAISGVEPTDPYELSIAPRTDIG